MNLRIYLDDCSYSKQLTAKLRAAGHDVRTPVEAGTLGLPDGEHLQRAINEARVLITHNCSDFEQLHLEITEHAGIIGIYQDNDPTRDMSYDDIVGALSNLLASGMQLENAFHVLNAWR